MLWKIGQEVKARVSSTAGFRPAIVREISADGKRVSVSFTDVPPGIGRVGNSKNLRAAIVPNTSTRIIPVVSPGNGVIK